MINLSYVMMEQSKSLIASISVIFEPNIDTAKRNIRKSLKISGILRSIVRKKENDKRRNEPLHYLHHQKNNISYCQMQCYEVEAAIFFSAVVINGTSLM